MGTKPKGPKAKAKREEPPLDDPNNWMPFADAFEAVYQHFNDRTLTALEFADIAPRLMLAVSTGDPPRPEKLRVKLDEIRPASQALLLGPKRQHVYVWRGAHRFILKATGQRGSLFVYKPDMKKYLPDVVGPAPKVEAEPKTAKRPRSSMLKKDWIQQAVEAFKLRRDFPDKTPNGIKDDLALLLQNNNRTVPDDSKLWDLVNWVFEFDRAPLDRSRLKRERKGKSA